MKTFTKGETHGKLAHETTSVALVPGEMQIKAIIETLLFLKEKKMRPVKSNKVYLTKKRGCRNTHYSKDG